MNRFKLTGMSVLLGFSVSNAFANGYHFLHQSAEGVGTAYSTNGTAASDLSAMFSNPSSIIRFDGTRISSGFVLDLPSSRLYNASATAPFSGGTVAVTGNPSEPKQPIDTAIGGSMYMSHEYRPGLIFGVGFNAPFAYVSEYPKTAVSRYTATKTALQAPNVSPTVAYRVNDQWALGGAINFQYYIATIDGQVATSVQNPSLATDLSSNIEGTDLAVGFSLGLEYQPTESTRIGVSYRSSIDHSFNADISLDGSDQNFQSLLNLAASNGVTITSRKGKASFDISTPSMLQFGLLHKLNDKVDLYANANLTGWKAFKDTVVSYDNGLATTVVDNNWDDSWFAALGFGYQYSDKLKFRAGAAYDWTPTPANTVSPRAPNNDRWNLGLGLSYQKSDDWKFDFGYQYIKFTQVNIDLVGGNNEPRGNLFANLELDAHIFMWQLNHRF